MEKILYFDYAAVAIYGLVIISCITRKMLKGRMNRDFLIMVIIAFASTVFDILSLFTERLGADFNTPQFIFHTLYILTHSFALPYYLIFIINLTGTNHLTVKNPTYNILVSIPLEIEVFVLVLNFFTHKLFVIDSAGVYIRGPLFFINYLVAVFYAVACMAQIIRHHRTLQPKVFWSVFILFPMIATAVLLQFFFPWLIIEMFSIAICVMYVSMVVLRPEENIDAETGFLRANSYVDQIRKMKLTGKHGSIILINISNFRSIYRSLGYQSSVQLTYEVAKVITRQCETLNGVEYYYLGNGRFRLVAENEDRPLLPDCAKKIQESLSEGFTFRDVLISLFCNVCIMSIPENVTDEKSAMLFDSQFGDLPYHQGVYYAKEIMRQKNYDIIQSLDQILEDAINNKKFEVYYQPIYSVKERRFTVAEALIRLKTEEFGFIPPDLFIPVAEQNGTIHRIGRYVLEEVCRFISSEDFKDLGITSIDVNLSTVQCLEKNLAKEISLILNEYKVEPSQINLEITETAATFEYAELQKNIENLNARGFQFSLDDFGTGYSNLGRAVEMPLSVIKLDKSITRIEQNTKLHAIGEHTVRMIKEMNMDIVAEGIEDEKTLKIFEEMGCDFIQGFYFSKPLPKDEFIKYIREHKNTIPKGTDYVEGATE